MERDPEQIETQHLLAYGDLTGHTVLEIGCGDGRLTWRYAAYPRRVTAFDLDSARLSFAVRDIPPHLRDKVSFLKASAPQLPFRAEMFDRAVLAWSL